MHPHSRLKEDLWRHQDPTCLLSEIACCTGIATCSMITWSVNMTL